MRKIDTGRVRILTFKEGVLSRVAHDLELEVERFEVTDDGGKLAATFFVDSIHVVGAIRDGAIDEGALSAKDKREIESNLRKDVLHAARHPEVRFAGALDESGDTLSIDGELEMAGQKRPQRVTARNVDGTVRGEVTLTPSSWGIRPFKALLGAIRLQDRVVLRFELPLPLPG